MWLHPPTALGTRWLNETLPASLKGGDDIYFFQDWPRISFLKRRLLLYKPAGIEAVDFYDVNAACKVADVYGVIAVAALAHLLA
jgi:hypothetical protein